MLYIIKHNINGLLLTFCCLSALLTGCNGNEEPEPIPVVEPQTITFAVDKTVIKSNDKEQATFSVSVDGKAVSTGFIIYFIDTPDKTLSGNTFATGAPGTYSFYAVYGKLKSDIITVTANPLVFAFTADTTLLKADGKSKVVFSATIDGEDVSNDAEFYYLEGETETAITGNIFTTETEGVYDFYCRYQSFQSDKTVITAFAIVLNLKANATQIKANGKEAVDFTVTADGEDVTAEAELFVKTSSGGENGENGENGETKLDGKSFATQQEGEYELFAKYKNKSTNTVNIAVIPSVIAISASKTTDLKTGDIITFNGVMDEKHDISSEMTLHIQHSGNNETINTQSFTVPERGQYSVYATYGNKTSNTLIFNVLPSSIQILCDKSYILFDGYTTATFTVNVDGKPNADAEVYQYTGDATDSLLADKKFATEYTGKYYFYARCYGLKSETIMIESLPANFAKSVLATEVVATWCGYSPRFLLALNDLHTIPQYAEHTNIAAIHAHYADDLYSSDIGSDIGDDERWTLNVPWAEIDMRSTVDYPPTAASVDRQSQLQMYTNPAFAGIGITSHRNGDNLDITLKIKLDKTKECRVGVLVVEDDIVMKQRLYPYYDDDHTDATYIDDFVHHGVATYKMPGYDFRIGKPLGTLQAYEVFTESFTIPLNKVTNRTVNFDKCRIVAYIMTYEYERNVVNNSISCPLGGSVRIRYK
ncbi:MAG: Omp28-related outer membrane protein [Tannerella sp.]|jgi:hypothetical protein|nr:Omp28-related outer membrane protein [Tannerella sp.]